MSKTSFTQLIAIAFIFAYVTNYIVTSHQEANLPPTESADNVTVSSDSLIVNTDSLSPDADSLSPDTDSVTVSADSPTESVDSLAVKADILSASPDSLSGNSVRKVRDKIVSFLLDGIGIDFVAVPGGNFQMGFVDADYDSTSAEITVEDFEMSETEITNAQYCAYLNAALSADEIAATSNFVVGVSGEYAGKEYIYIAGIFDDQNRCHIYHRGNTFHVRTGMEKRPVVYVTWFGAMAFAKNYGLDLPSDVEWEYAARGGRQHKYATNTGGISSSKVNYRKLVGHPVEAENYVPNPFGLLCMSGNVWEWCGDWFDEDYRKNRPEGDMDGPDFGFNRVLRGGSWFSQAYPCRTAFATSFEPGFRFHNLGFRVVRRSE